MELLLHDGRVEGFPQINNSDVSTDGLYEEALRFSNVKIVSKGLTKVGESTTNLMKLAGEMGYKYTLLVSCDEYVEGDSDLLVSNLNHIPLKEPSRIVVPFVEHNMKDNWNNNGGKFVAERIVYLPIHVYIKSVHWLYYHRYHGAEVLMDKRTPLAMGITVHHDDTIREGWRNKMMDDFQVKQREYEQKKIYEIMREELEPQYHA